jgi:hypothetical protein
MDITEDIYLTTLSLEDYSPKVIYTLKDLGSNLTRAQIILIIMTVR